MDYLQVLEISASGLGVQKARLEAAAQNLANTQTIRAADGQPYQPVKVVSRSASQGRAFGLLLDGAGGLGAQAEVVRDLQVQPRLVYEPGHPHADKSGMVRYPGVDHLSQMVSVTEALRAYEANLAALQAARTMASRALDIGGNQ